MTIPDSDACIMPLHATSKLRKVLDMDNAASAGRGHVSLEHDAHRFKVKGVSAPCLQAISYGRA